MSDFDIGNSLTSVLLAALSATTVHVAEIIPGNLQNWAYVVAMCSGVFSVANVIMDWVKYQKQNKNQNKQ